MDLAKVFRKISDSSDTLCSLKSDAPKKQAFQFTKSTAGRRNNEDQAEQWRGTPLYRRNLSCPCYDRSLLLLDKPSNRRFQRAHARH